MKKVIIALTLGMLIGSAATAVAATNETLTAYVTDYILKINGKEQKLANKIVTINDSSYLPVREVANLLNMNVGFDDKTGTVQLTQAAVQGEPTTPSQPVSAKEPDLTVWISLRDAGTQYNIAIYGDRFVKGSTAVNVDFSQAYKDNPDYKTLSINTEFGVLTIMPSEKGTYLNKSELEALLSKMP